MKKYIILTATAWLCAIALQVKSQNIEKVFTPKIGDTLPEYRFTDLRNSTSEQLSLSELKGKWLILDFWSNNCSSCIASFPKMNKLHEKFKDSLKIIMVGDISDIQHVDGKITKREKITKDLYQRLAKLYNLKLTVAFDSFLANHYGIRYLPYLVIVDPKGIVRYITVSVNEAAVTAIVRGDKPTIRSAYTGPELDSFEKNYKQEEIISVKNDDRDLSAFQLYRSQLLLFDQKNAPVSGNVNLSNPNLANTKTAMSKGLFKAECLQIQALFRIAYFGFKNELYLKRDTILKYAKDFIFETPDSIKFLNNLRYSYQIIVPVARANPRLFQNILQRELEIYFGLRGRVEKRATSVYYLKIIDPTKAAKLTTQGKADRYIRDTGLPKNHQLIEHNISVETLCHILGNLILNPPIVDKTGLIGNIDINLQANLLDVNEIKKELQKYGLTLERGFKEMETIIISDSRVFK